MRRFADGAVRAGDAGAGDRAPGCLRPGQAGRYHQGSARPGHEGRAGCGPEGRHHLHRDGRRFRRVHQRRQGTYEVACQQGLGYVVLSGKTTKAYDCVATQDQKSLACRLPANADPKEGLKPIIAASGATCTPTKARYIGANAATIVYEVACQEGPGFILQAPAPGAAAAAVVAMPCIQAQGNLACTLTSKAQNDAYLSGAGEPSPARACQISASRYIGADAKTSGWPITKSAAAPSRASSCRGEQGRRFGPRPDLRPGAELGGRLHLHQRRDHRGPGDRQLYSAGQGRPASTATSPRPARSGRIPTTTTWLNSPAPIDQTVPLQCFPARRKAMRASWIASQPVSLGRAQSASSRPRSHFFRNTRRRCSRRDERPAKFPAPATSAQTEVAISSS